MCLSFAIRLGDNVTRDVYRCAVRLEREARILHQDNDSGQHRNYQSLWKGCSRRCPGIRSLQTGNLNDHTRKQLISDDRSHGARTQRKRPNAISEKHRRFYRTLRPHWLRLAAPAGLRSPRIGNVKCATRAASQHVLQKCLAPWTAELSTTRKSRF